MNPHHGHDHHREKAQFYPKPFIAVWAPTIAAIGISWLTVKEIITIASVLCAICVTVVVGIRQWKLLKRESQADELMILVAQARTECTKSAGGDCPLQTTLRSELERLERKR